MYNPQKSQCFTGCFTAAARGAFTGCVPLVARRPEPAKMGPESRVHKASSASQRNSMFDLQQISLQSPNFAGCNPQAIGVPTATQQRFTDIFQPEHEIIGMIPRMV
jgi:hypothetical protein